MAKPLWITVARLNFDDPIMGVYRTRAEAMARAEAIDAEVGRIEKLSDETKAGHAFHQLFGGFTDACDVTGYIACAVYRAEYGSEPAVNVYQVGDKDS